MFVYIRVLKRKYLDAKNWNLNQDTFILTFVPANNYKLLCKFTYGQLVNYTVNMVT